MRLFSSQRHKDDPARMKQARDFAYANRAMIHRAFDDGELKQVVFDRLGEMFVASNLVDGAADGSDGAADDS